MVERRKTRTVFLDNIGIGSEYPISIQSMTNTDTRNVEATLEQISKLKKEGCEIIRVAVPDKEAAEGLKYICQKSVLPLVADIHFDYRLALIAAESGASGLRINPGNIGKESAIREVSKKASYFNIPIRIGVNAGSLEKKIMEKYKEANSEAMVESALYNAELLEKYSFKNIKLSLKSSNVTTTIEAYRKIAKLTDYPLHLGVTEAGSRETGIIKSAIGIGSLLSQGIGDTIRVSLTGDPLKEIPIAKKIIETLGIRKRTGVEIISCPTCGRCKIDLELLLSGVEKSLEGIDYPLKIAVMGCPVNGPGEAKEADLGIAGGDGVGLIFKKGMIIDKVDEAKLIDRFREELIKMRRSDDNEND